MSTHDFAHGSTQVDPPVAGVLPPASAGDGAQGGALALPVRITAIHRRRLRSLWRSAGWPSHDIVEAELLVAGLLARREDERGRTTLRLTDAGVHELVRSTESHRSARSVHEALVSRVAASLARDGRIAWCGLSLRERTADAGEAAGASRWQMSMPDVYSVRQTSVPAYLQPVVHEIKVSRADLLADLRQPAKRAAYLQMAGAVYYVLATGVGQVDDVPPECGVILAHGPPDQHVRQADEPAVLEILRHAPTRLIDAPAGLPFAIWMALARMTPHSAPADPQMALDAGGEPPGADAGTDLEGSAPR